MNRQDEFAQSGLRRSRTTRDRRIPWALRRRAVGALLVAGLVNSGCYHYVAVSPAAAASNDEVRVRITSAAATRLAGELGTYSTELDGKLSLRGADSLAVAVPIGRQYRGTTLESETQVLTFDKSEIVDVRRSELSRGRTFLTSAGVLAGFALLVRAVVQLTNPNPGEDKTLPPPPPPNGSRVPSGHHLRVRIPFP